MLKRLALVADEGVIAKVFYPVFPPDRNAADVLAWLEANRR
jgi:peroxiredoxin